jgi:3-phenylpropionate/trans-cinnamate dioxygenase ferredoxin reductase subunit
VLLIGAETERPYERPPLSKDYLRGESPREKVYVHKDGYFEKHQIELVTGAVVSEIDIRRSQVTLADDRAYDYDRLLLATGAEPRRIAIRGAELDGIYYLRTIADSDALRDRLRAGAHVAVVGGGWIGCEFAASARQLGVKVTIVDPLALPNEHVFGAEIGAFYRDVHREHGVELAFGDQVEAFEGNGTVARVRTAAGRVIDCDFVVVGVGAAPRVELASHAKLNVGNGILVDEALATSAPHVYAAGDVACAWNPFYGEQIRVEHWANALHQGRAAARAMLGEEVSYDRIPYFYSDQYDIGMEYSGYTREWDEVAFRGDPANRKFIAFWLANGRVVAGMNVNVWDVNKFVEALIRSRVQVDGGALTDPDTPLESLVPESVTNR